MENLEELRKVSIHDILLIRNTGRNTHIPCPFHNETKPSFVLYADNSYYCFGCAVSGQNSIDFLLETGASFQEVIKELKKYI